MAESIDIDEDYDAINDEEANLIAVAASHTFDKEFASELAMGTLLLTSSRDRITED